LCVARPRFGTNVIAVKEFNFHGGLMPTYVAPDHPECRIDCPGKGGASFIPPYSCVTWCDQPEALIQALGTAVQQDGWSFQSSLHGVLRGADAKQLALALLSSGFNAVPASIRQDLGTVRDIGGNFDESVFQVSWLTLPFEEALRQLVEQMIAQSSGGVLAT
jgi:hypothetical protein